MINATPLSDAVSFLSDKITESKDPSVEIPTKYKTFAVLGGRAYRLWHDPQQVINRCQRFIRTGIPGCPCVQEKMLSSNFNHLLALRRNPTGWLIDGFF